MASRVHLPSDEPTPAGQVVDVTDSALAQALLEDDAATVVVPPVLQVPRVEPMDTEVARRIAASLEDCSA